jgi:hypothetical protein
VPAGDPSANRQSADQPQIVTLSLAHNVTRGTEVDHGHDAIAGATDSHDRRMRAGRTNCTTEWTSRQCSPLPVTGVRRCTTLSDRLAKAS